MSLRNLAAALGLVIATVGAGSAADAQPDRRDGYHRDGQDRRYNDNGRHRGWNNDRGRGRGHGWNNQRRCWTEWRHHRRVRVCR
ncbi:MAG: hypothetical protein EOP68_21130 [Sphingomonas sp.]|nr:MAG: hypothetical protein EOP68_21130 [Sphingomonas sp.]